MPIFTFSLGYGFCFVRVDRLFYRKAVTEHEAASCQVAFSQHSTVLNHLFQRVLPELLVRTHDRRQHGDVHPWVPAQGSDDQFTHSLGRGVTRLRGQVIDAPYSKGCSYYIS